MSSVVWYSLLVSFNVLCAFIMLLSDHVHTSVYSVILTVILTCGALQNACRDNSAM